MMKTYAEGHAPFRARRMAEVRRRHGEVQTRQEHREAAAAEIGSRQRCRDELRRSSRSRRTPDKSRSCLRRTRSQHTAQTDARNPAKFNTQLLSTFTSLHF